MLILFLVLCSAVNAKSEIATDNQDGKIVDWFFSLFGATSTTTSKPALQKICEPCACGVQPNKTKIINGEETKINEYTWMVYLTYKGTFHCGASLINERYLLTSANAMSIARIDYLRAIFLDHDRSITDESETAMRRVSKIIKHENFVSNNGYNNDIALLKLDRAVELDNLPVVPICITETNSFEGEMGNVLGWGATEEFGDYANTLQEVKVPIWSNEQCRSTDYGEKVTDNMFCAGYVEGGKDACKGDSGGPLFVNKNDVAYLVGIVSWGSGCAEANSPGVYTKVAKYIAWIKAKTQNSCFCDANI